MALSESFSITQNYFGHKDNETGSKITRRRGRAREKVREVQFENGNVKFMRRRVGTRQQLLSRHSRERERAFCVGIAGRAVTIITTHKEGHAFLKLLKEFPHRSGRSFSS